MIRKAKPQDIPAIVELAIESVMIDPIPVTVSREAMAETAEVCMQPSHFCYVSEIDGVVVGVVAAQVSPGFWFEKLSCSIAMHYSTVPGEWVKLMRELSKWIKSRSGIKMAIMEVEPHHDERIIRFLKRLGFARQTQTLTYLRDSHV